MLQIHPLSDLPQLNKKKVLVRIDSDVDIQNGKILDATRLESSLDTVRYVIKHGGSVILLGHLGRPDGKVKAEFTLEPVAKWYAHKFGGRVKEIKLGNFLTWQVAPQIILVENLRFYKGEEQNPHTGSGLTFTKQLASLGDIYVNEAFAVSHRDHASITGLAKLLPSYAGFHLQKEIGELSKILENPKRPLVVLIGGAKIETKLPMVEKMHHVADYVLVGGKIAEETKTLIKVQHEKIQGHKSVVLVADNTPDGLDITVKDTENFIQIISLAKTIVWNGPMGKMGEERTEKNTLEIARAIIESKAYSVVGGGDSLTLLKQHNLLDKFNFVSTGGGAMLEFLSGKTLPGIKTLET